MNEEEKLVAPEGYRLVLTREDREGKTVQFMQTIRPSKWLAWIVRIAKEATCLKFETEQAAYRVSDGLYVKR